MLATQELTELQALEIAVDYLPQIKIIAARACRYTKCVQSAEVESFLVSRMFGILSNYSPTLSSLATHISRNLCWYAYKFVCAELRRCSVNSNLQQQRSYLPVANLDSRDLVSNILDGLSEYHQALLYMRFIAEMTQEEIAGELGISKSTARNHIMEALAEAREIANIE